MEVTIAPAGTTPRGVIVPASQTMTFERWLAHQPHNRGIVPPWLDPNKAWPPMPEPEDNNEQE